jgi:hypothetical protein
LAAGAVGAHASPVSEAQPASTAAATESGAWSAATTLSACRADGAPHAAFPRDSPTHATGTGAVVWNAPAGCPGATGTLVSVIGPDDLPGPATPARTSTGAALSLRSPLALAPAPHGQLAIASSGAPAGGDGQLVQGAARGPFSMLATIPGRASQSALATGYLGDLAVASPSGRGARAGVRVDVERYFARRSSPSRIVPAQDGAVQALTVGLDFRSDAIAAWSQNGALYARDLPASGQPRATQRLARVGSEPRVTAVISDDNRAIVAWADERAGTTSIYIDISRSAVRFGSPQLLERFVDPGSLRYPSTSPRLVRLSSESVMLAWTGAQDGRWVIRTAAIGLDGLRPASTISDPDADSLLSDLQPGPDGEAIALWTEPRRSVDGQLDTGDQALLAARGVSAASGITVFAGPEQLAVAGANDDATLAFDPSSDRAIAVWRDRSVGLRYAVRTSSQP